VIRAVALALAVALGGCPAAPGSGPEASREPGVPLSTVEEAFAACLDGDPADGVARLDALVVAGRTAPDALVARGLCRWALWDETGAREDARGAYRDLTAAIRAVEAGGEARGTPLDQIYGHRAFVAQAVDGGWVRTLEDLGRAVALAPLAPQHLLDRGVVHSYAGDTLAARTDLRAYLALTDSVAGDDPERRSVVEALLDDLGPPAAPSPQ